MKKIITLLLLLAGTGAFAQELNGFKYLIVPERYEFQKAKGEYDINDLAQKMFEKYGFTVLTNNAQYPTDLSLDRCKALYADIEESGVLHTNLTIIFRDCSGKTIYSSIDGRSKLKDKRKAYYQALREASQSLAGLDYKYSGDAGATAKTVDGTVPAAAARAVNNPNQLTAKATNYGYELLDAKGAHFLKMYKTSQPDSYSAQMETINGLVFKKGNEWFFEYFIDDKAVSQKLDIRF